MLSYQHSYHAGNFADVHKHLILSRVLEALHRKAKPFCYYETHAGRGRYDLSQTEAQKTAEYQQGIGRLWEQAQVPELARPYQTVIQQLNPQPRLRYYPGSPALAHHWLRAQDRLQLMELHPQEAQALKELFRGDRQVGVHQRDGFEGVLALTPPPEKRGLVLIDPSYELKEDYRQLPQWVDKLFQRWSSAICAIWYPLLPAGRHQLLLKGLEQTGLRKILVAELEVAAAGETGMYGSGMAVINAPWQLDQELEQLMPWLVSLLGQDSAACQRVTWLVPE